MTEEIKEILDYIDDRIMPNEKWDKIKDYITNLQQLYENALKVNQNSHKYITELEMNNAILKEKINTLKSNFEVEIDDCENYKKWYRDYKSRCEKAIEYIENNKKETSSHFNGKEYVYRNFTLYCEPNDLLNILNGGDENE